MGGDLKRKENCDKVFNAIAYQVNKSNKFITFRIEQGQCGK